MGQKVNPIGLRPGINRTWDSRWYAEGGEYSKMLHEDIHIRKVLRERLSQAGVARIVIERPAKRARVTIHTARPGVVIGKKGADIDYGIATAFTTFGTCGVKVWVFKGEIMAHDPMAHDKRAEEAAPQRTPARVERTEQRDA